MKMIGLVIICVSCSIFISATYADRNERQWVWDDNKRHSERFNFNSDSQSEAAGRYEVYENEPLFSQNNQPLYTEVLPRPQPTIPGRPGSLYLDNNQAAYGFGVGSYQVTNGVAQGVLTGPIQNQVPLQDLDRCKCTQKFNCPGISYGHCDVGKQYCCYSSSQVNPHVGFRPVVPTNSIDSNGVLIGPAASRPGYGLENGVLKGPVRPINRPHRPPFVEGFATSNRRPSNGNTYSITNGVLVGPEGPVDRPTYGFARNN